MKRFAVGVVIAATVFAAVFLLVRRSDEPKVSGLSPAGPDPLAHGRVDVGPYRGVYSPDGGRLAVLSGEGLALAEAGKVRPITPRGSHVADVAWFPAGTAVLVAEGPVPTGELAVIGVDGKSQGTVTLHPSFGVGNGSGMTVSPDNRTAVVTAAERPTLGDRTLRWLVKVDLSTGTATDLTPHDDTDEFGPAFLDPDTVVYTTQARGRPPAVRSIDLRSGQILDIVSGATALGPLPDDRVAVLEGSEIVGVRRDGGGRAVRMGRVPSATEVVAVHPTGTLALVAGTVVDPANGQQATQLRAVRLHPQG